MKKILSDLRPDVSSSEPERKPMPDEKFPFEGDEQPKAEPEKTPEPEKEKTNLSQIPVSAGLMIPQTHSELVRVAAMLLESKALPAQYKTVPQTLMGMQILRQLNLPDIACLRFLAIINGSFSLWGDAPKALVDRTGTMANFSEFWFDKEYNEISFANKNLNAEAYGGLCRAERKGNPFAFERVFTIDDAKKAGLYRKDGPWTKYERRMLQMRARSWVLKDGWPDALLGVAIAEWDHNVLVESDETIGVKNSIAKELNEEFLKDPKQQGE